MEYKVFLIGHSRQQPQQVAAHNAAFSEAGAAISCEYLEVQPVNFHRTLTELSNERGFLGAAIAGQYSFSILPYCQELSAVAQSMGAVNSLVRRPSGLIYGHNTDVSAFVQCLRNQDVRRVRTALIMGAGSAARIALAGLRELNCARYLVGYRHPRRPPELMAQFKGIRRQITFFPLEEMQQFFSWAEQQGVLNGVSTTTDDEHNGVMDKDPKSWDLLINASPVGQRGQQPGLLISIPRFMLCVERVFDMATGEALTPLIEMAKLAGLPTIEGRELLQLEADYSREMWLREYRRYAGEEPQEGLGRARRRMSLKRRER